MKFWFQYALEKDQSIQEQIFLIGISNLILTANEWGGVAFAMALMVHSKKCYDLFQKIYKWKYWKIRKMQAANYQHEDSNDLSNDNNSSVEDDKSSEHDVSLTMTLVMIRRVIMIVRVKKAAMLCRMNVKK